MSTSMTIAMFGLNLVLVSTLCGAVFLAGSFCFPSLPKRYAMLTLGLLAMLLAPVAVATGTTFSLGSLPAINIVDQTEPAAIQDADHHPASSETTRLSKEWVPQNAATNSASTAVESHAMLTGSEDKFRSTDHQAANPDSRTMLANNERPPASGSASQNPTVPSEATPGEATPGGIASDTTTVVRHSPAKPARSVAVFGFLIAWLLGTMVLLGRQVLRLVRCRNFLATCRPVQDECVQATFTRVAHRLGIQRHVQLLESESLSAPVVVAARTLRVILPADLQVSLTSRQLSAVLAHELSHIARKDHLAAAAQTLAKALYWWHPLVYSVSGRMNVLRELICDDIATAQEAAPQEYAQSLVQLAEQTASRRVAIGSLGVSLSGVSEMQRRIRRILTKSSQQVDLHITKRFAVGLSVLATVMLAGMVFAQVPQPTQPAAPPQNQTQQTQQQADPPAENKSQTAPSKPAPDDTSEKPSAATTANKSPQSDAKTRKSKQDEAPTVILKGTVVDAEGNPVSGISVLCQELPHSKTLLKQLSDDTGTFQFEVEKPSTRFAFPLLTATSPDSSQKANFRFPTTPDTEVSIAEPIIIKLEPTKSATVQVIDGGKQPIANASVALQLTFPWVSELHKTDDSGKVTFILPKSEVIRTVVAWKDGKGLDYQTYTLPYKQKGDLLTKAPEFPYSSLQTLTLDGAAPVSVNVVDDDQQPIEDVATYAWLFRKESQPNHLNLGFFNQYFTQRTDPQGTTSFEWFPAWQKNPTTIWPIAEHFTRTRSHYDPSVHPGEIQVQLLRQMPLRGQVTFADGSPAAGIGVAADGAGYSVDRFRLTTQTDANGRYEIWVDPNQIYLLSIDDKTWGAPSQSGFAVLPKQEIPERNFQLSPATRVYGRVLNKTSGEPVSGQRIYFRSMGTPLDELKAVKLPNPEDSRTWVQPMRQQNVTSPEDGTFEFFVGDGDYKLFISGNETQEFTIKGEASKQVDLLVEVTPTQEFTGTIVDDATGKPVANATIKTASQNFDNGVRDWRATTDVHGKFKVQRPAEPTYLHVVNEDKTLGAIARITADDVQAEIRLRPLGTAHGRLMNEDGTQPAPGLKLHAGIKITDVGGSLSSNRLGQYITTDQDGWFTLTELVPSWKYKCILAEYPGGRVLTVTIIQVGAGKSIELGELKTPTPRKPYVPPTLEERIERAFSVAGTAEERFDKAKDMIQAADQNLLVVFGQPKDPRIHDLMKIRYQDEDYQKLSEDYLVLAIPTDAEHFKDAQTLATKIDSDTKLPTDGSVFLAALLNPAAEPLAVLNSSQLCDGEQLSKDRLLEHLDKFKIATLNGQTLLNEALKTAQQENKRVLIQESATWCGPCHRLSQLLDENRQWEQDYVWVRMDHRWTKAREIMKKIRDGAEGGIPWFAILDADGKVLATSNNPETGDNIGFPGKDSSRTHFANMLKATRQRMSDEEIQKLISATEPKD